MSKKLPQDIHEEIRPLLHADDFDPLRVAQVLLEWKQYMMRHRLTQDEEWADALQVSCDALDRVFAQRKGMASALMGIANLLRLERDGRDTLTTRIYRLERMLAGEQAASEGVGEVKV